MKPSETDKSSHLLGVPKMGVPLVIRNFTIQLSGIVSGFPGCLLNGFREGPCDGHHLAHRLHLRPQGALHRGKLVDIPARNLAQWGLPPDSQIEIQWLVTSGHPVLVLRILSSMGDLQDPIDGGTLVPYFRPYFGGIFPYHVAPCDPWDRPSPRSSPGRVRNRPWCSASPSFGG